MLKRTITYDDFDNKKVSETFWFNITKTELSKNLHLVKNFEHLQKIFSEKHELTIEEIEQVFEFVQILMKLSYGIRLDDGKRFAKSDEIWLEFTQTAAYDAFTFSLFENPENANDFMIGIFPQDLIESAQAQIKNESKTSTDVQLPPEVLSVKHGDPEGKFYSKQPVDKEVAEMTREELLEAMQRRTDKEKPVIE